MNKAKQGIFECKQTQASRNGEIKLFHLFVRTHFVLWLCISGVVSCTSITLAELLLPDSIILSGSNSTVMVSSQVSQLIQNATARVLTNTKKVDHITPVLKSLHWLPVCQIIDFKILLLVYKALNGFGPKYISELLNSEPSRTLRSSGLLPVPRVVKHFELPCCLASLKGTYSIMQNALLYVFYTWICVPGVPGNSPSVRKHNPLYFPPYPNL